MNFRSLTADTLAAALTALAGALPLWDRAAVSIFPLQVVSFAN
jgi:hypothetical protein